jgi:hypothetical protein
VREDGLRRDGHLIENAFIKGEWVDPLIYDILAQERAVDRTYLSVLLASSPRLLNL